MNIDTFNFFGKKFLTGISFSQDFFFVEEIEGNVTVTQALISTLNLLYAISYNINAIIGSNDSAFHPNILESFNHTNHIKFIDSIPYFPQSNGLNERYQQTILNICKAAIIEFNPPVETISQLLSHCAFINNSTFHKSINCIPYEKAKITVDLYDQAITPLVIQSGFVC